MAAASAFRLVEILGIYLGIADRRAARLRGQHGPLRFVVSTVTLAINRLAAAT